MTRRPTIAVSDHAVLRWLERVEGLDVAALRNQIAAHAAVGLSYGCDRVVVGAGKLVIEDGTVATVLRRDHYRSIDIGHTEVVLAGDIIARRRQRRRGRR